MKKRLTNLDGLVASLKPYLQQYLEEHGINTKQNFRCLNPKHEDRTPSMTCLQVPEQAFCFGCNFTCDVFAAAHILEGKPKSGRGWVEDNLLYLAKKYGVTIALEDLTQEEIYEYRTYQAYRLAAELIANPEFGDYSHIQQEIDRRKWDTSKIAEWGIGTVNLKEFRERLKSAGFEAGFLDGIDLSNSRLFNEHNLLFTVHDDEGRPVGFSAKNLKHDGGKENGPKYVNTRVTGLECAIFKKGERLYGFDVAKEANQPLYIFEGQADVVTARHYGLMNCCCTLGTAFTDHHINLLKRYAIFNIVLVFDADEAGSLAVQKILDEKLAKERDFRVRLIQLPAGQDPDELLRTKNIDEFVRLKKWTAFEWRMMQFMEKEEETLDPHEVAEKMIPIIVSEPSRIRQEDMARQVAKATGYDLSTVLSEVKRLRDEKEAEIQTKKRNVIEALVSEVRYHPENAETALAECQHAIDDINKTVDQDDKNSSSVLSFVLSQKEHDEKKKAEFAGFHLRPDGLGGIGSRLDDDWKSDTLVFIGGGEQSGKTSVCTQMAYELASDLRNDAICIYMSIDDAARFILYKLVCMATGSLEMFLKAVSHPNYWSQQPGYEYIVSMRQHGYQRISQLVQDQRIILKEATHGTSLDYLEQLAKHYRSQHPTRNIVMFVDSFHKLTDFGHIQGQERIKRMCNRLKNITTEHHITAIATAEYRKLKENEQPSNVALAESRALQYDASVILHLYNDLHIKGEQKAVLMHDHNGMVAPRIQCKFGKNKISGYEDREFLDLYPFSAQFRAVDKETAIRDQKTRVDFLAENKSSIF